jgi:hypothetical protein
MMDLSDGVIDSLGWVFDGRHLPTGGWTCGGFFRDFVEAPSGQNSPWGSCLAHPPKLGFAG